MMQTWGNRISTTGQSTDDHPIGGVEFGDELPCDVAQFPSDTMPIHRSTNRFRDDQSDLRANCRGCTVGMHDEIGLGCTHSVLDGVAELRRPCHPVMSREHCEVTGGSGSQRTTALAAPASNDGAAGTSTHPQTETVDPGPAPVVRLEGALALGHDCLSSSHGVHAGSLRSWTLRPSCSIEPARSRTPVAAVSPVVGRLPEGTDVACAGQTVLPGTRLPLWINTWLPVGTGRETC